MSHNRYDVYKSTIENESEKTQFYTHICGYYAQIYKYAYRLIRSYEGNTDDACDVVQMVYVAALNKYDMLKSHQNVLGWLYTTAKYMAYNMMKSNKNKAVREPCLDDFELSVEDEYNVDGNLFDSCKKILRENEMQLITDYYQRGITLSEMAHKNGKSVGAVKMQLQRIYKKLQKLS